MVEYLEGKPEAMKNILLLLGKGVATITFYLPNWVQCAEATCDNIGAKTAAVITRKDNRSNTIPISNSAIKEKEIAEWLSENYYL